VWYALRPGVLEQVVEAGVPKEAINLGCCRLELPLDGGEHQAGRTG
jgi:hypothetical protein